MKRMDEMELHIQLSAMRWAWLVILVVLGMVLLGLTGV